MYVKLMPLNGKYYGSTIALDTPYGETEFTIWHSANYKPSERQLKYWDMSLEEAKEEGMMCDSHFETEWTQNFCEYIVECIKNYNHK